jgi:hypothetical protein
MIRRVFLAGRGDVVMHGTGRLVMRTLAVAAALAIGCGEPAEKQGGAGDRQQALPPGYEKFRQAITKAARDTFKAARDSRPGERFYAYALYTDDDATGPVPAANTVQAVDRAIKRYASRGQKPPNPAYLRYDPAEWVCVGAKAGDKDWRAVWEMSDTLSKDDRIKLPERRKNLLRVMQLSLAELDREGFFGVGAEREGVALMLWIIDSADAEEVRQRSIRELNPPAVYNRFLADSKGGK